MASVAQLAYWQAFSLSAFLYPGAFCCSGHVSELPHEVNLLNLAAKLQAASAGTQLSGGLLVQRCKGDLQIRSIKDTNVSYIPNNHFNTKAISLKQQH